MLVVASGEADTLFVNAGTATAQWETGRVRGVAVTSQERLYLLRSCRSRCMRHATCDMRHATFLESP
jgi:hypothetical protein